MNTLPDYKALPERITNAAERVRDLDKQLSLERERRDDLIAQAIDEAGMTTAAVARAAGLSQPRIMTILSRFSDD